MDRLIYDFKNIHVIFKVCLSDGLKLKKRVTLLLIRAGVVKRLSYD
jgi:hypothetical protein